MKNTHIYEAAINKWGRHAQLNMLLEESIELAMAARKLVRASEDINVSAKEYERRKNDLAGEAADVTIMLEQMMYIFPEMEAKISTIKDEKLARLLKRIDKQ